MESVEKYIGTGKYQINRYGLYRTTVGRWEIPGLKSDDRLDDQTSGWWLPFFGKGGIYMVDTYHIDPFTLPCQSLKDIIKMAAVGEDNSWLIAKADGNYYYGGTVKVADLNADGYTVSWKMQYFQERCSLDEFEITQKNPDYYDDSDVVEHAQLYFEHAWPHGVTLLRKGAEESPDRKAMSLCWRVCNSSDRALSYIDAEELKKLSASERVSDRTKKLISMVLNLAAEYEQLDLQKRILDNNFRKQWDEILYPEDEETVE